VCEKLVCKERGVKKKKKKKKRNFKLLATSLQKSLRRHSKTLLKTTTYKNP